MADEKRLQPFLVAYPNIAEWVMGTGWVELGQDDR